MDLKLSKKTLDWYVSAGLLVPIGLLEQYQKDHGKVYVPSISASIMYQIINGAKYKQSYAD